MRLSLMIVPRSGRFRIKKPRVSQNPEFRQSSGALRASEPTIRWRNWRLEKDFMRDHKSVQKPFTFPFAFFSFRLLLSEKSGALAHLIRRDSVPILQQDMHMFILIWILRCRNDDDMRIKGERYGSFALFVFFLFEKGKGKICGLWSRVDES